MGRVRRGLAAPALLVAALVAACAILLGCGRAAQQDEALSTPIEHEYTQTIARGATIAHLLLATDAPMAGDVAPDDIALGGALQGFAVSEAVRVDDATLGLTVELPEGTDPQRDDQATVQLAGSAFAEPREEGQLIELSVEDPMATIIPLDGSYEEGEETFFLPVSLDVAEFVREPEAEDFSLADESLTIIGVDYDGYSLNEATLRIGAADAGSVRKAFDALDATLTADGIRVAADATNCGELLIGSDDMRKAKREGRSVTALACLAARPVAQVEATHAIESEKQGKDGLTDYDVHLQTAIEARPGSCHLPDDIAHKVSVEPLTGDGKRLLEESVTRLEDAKLHLDIALPGTVAEALTSKEGRNALVVAQPLVAQLARAHKLVLDAGVLSNAWGVDEPRVEVPLTICRDLARDEAQERLSYAEQHELIESGGEVEPGESSSSDADGFGLAHADAGDLGTAQGRVTWIREMGEDIRTIDAKLDLLSLQLADAEKRLGCYDALSELRALVAQTEIYGPAIAADEQGVAALQSAYGLDARRGTLRLGELVPDALKKIDACADATLAWEPERQLSHRLYVTQLRYAYLCGYTAAAQSQGKADAALEESYQKTMAALG